MRFVPITTVALATLCIASGCAVQLQRLEIDPALTPDALVNGKVSIMPVRSPDHSVPEDELVAIGELAVKELTRQHPNIEIGPTPSLRVAMDAPKFGKPDEQAEVAAKMGVRFLLYVVASDYVDHKDTEDGGQEFRDGEWVDAARTYIREQKIFVSMSLFDAETKRVLFLASQKIDHTDQKTREQGSIGQELVGAIVSGVVGADYPASVKPSRLVKPTLAAMIDKLP